MSIFSIGASMVAVTVDAERIMSERTLFSDIGYSCAISLAREWGK